MLAASQHLQVLLQLLNRAQLQAHGHVLAQPTVLLRQAPDKLRFLLLCGELSSTSLRDSIRSKLASPRFPSSPLIGTPFLRLLVLIREPNKKKGKRVLLRNLVAVRLPPAAAAGLAEALPHHPGAVQPSLCPNCNLYLEDHGT